jgi:hypothetical protein
MAPFISGRICAQLLVFARVFHIHGTKRPCGTLVEVEVHQADYAEM